jgi:hypothetical protein
MVMGMAVLLISAILLVTVNTDALYVDAAVLLLVICIYVGWCKRP